MLKESVRSAGMYCGLRIEEQRTVRDEADDTDYGLLIEEAIDLS
jgi:hypothetical protein